MPITMHCDFRHLTLGGLCCYCDIPKDLHEAWKWAGLGRRPPTSWCVAHKQLQTHREWALHFIEKPIDAEK